MTCDTCSHWEFPARGILVSGGHNRLCPFASVPPGYGAMWHGMDFSHPSEELTFDGTYPLDGERTAGYKAPPPPGQSQ